MSLDTWMDGGGNKLRFSRRSSLKNSEVYGGVDGGAWKVPLSIA